MFPEVLPAHVQKVEERAFAMETLTHVQKMEAVQIYTYIDDAYAKYRESATEATVSGVPENVFSGAVREDFLLLADA